MGRSVRTVTEGHLDDVGYGDRASVRFDASERRTLAARKPETALASGAQLPVRVTRAIVWVRRANLIEGRNLPDMEIVTRSPSGRALRRGACESRWPT